MRRKVEDLNMRVALWGDGGWHFGETILELWGDEGGTLGRHGWHFGETDLKKNYS